jgi:oxygen-independent coproporphyrinogen-3 oxidase
VGVQRGLIKVPGEDEVADMYELIGERLEKAGYRQYEISNFSRVKPCAHNLVYWHDQRYLAFGPGASGYWGDTRYTTVLGPSDYISLIAKNESVLTDIDKVTREGEIGEFMMLGLRLNAGISRTEFRRRFGVEVEETFGAELDRLYEFGLLEQVDGWVRLTARGRLLGNEVFERFI